MDMQRAPRCIQCRIALFTPLYTNMGAIAGRPTAVAVLCLRCSAMVELTDLLKAEIPRSLAIVGVAVVVTVVVAVGVDVVT